MNPRLGVINLNTNEVFTVYSTGFLDCCWQMPTSQAFMALVGYQLLSWSPLSFLAHRASWLFLFDQYLLLSCQFLTCFLFCLFFLSFFNVLNTKNEIKSKSYLGLESNLHKRVNPHKFGKVFTSAGCIVCNL